MLRHAVDAAEVTTVGDRDPQVSNGALEWVDQLRRTGLSAVKLDNRCIVRQRHGLYAMPSQPLRHHIGSLADIGHVVQKSLPLWPPAIGPSIQDIQPAIAGRAARLSARVTRVAPALRSWVQEEAQPLRPAAAVRLVFSSQVFWRPAF